MLQTKLAVNSSNVASRTVGKFYQTQRVSAFSNTHDDDIQQPKIQRNAQQIKTRTKSAGHIYNTRSSANKEKVLNVPSVTPSQALTKFDYDRLINYNEVEKKLSNYLQCTIRTNSRQKYNYLSNHYNPRYESLASNQLRMEQNYGNNRQQNLLRVVQNSTNYQSGVLQQRIPSLNIPISAPKASYKQGIIQKKTEKENQIDKSQKKSLKNSRKNQSKQLLRNQQQSASKNQNKENIYNPPIKPKKQNILGLVSMNHEEHKNELENKLKKLISNYQVKNKELENQLKKIQTKASPVESEKKLLTPSIETDSKEQPQVYKNDQLKEILSKLIQFNLKGINLNKQCNDRHQQIWKSIHQQILADQQMRIIKIFINQSNMNIIFDILNENRIKKIDISVLKTHPDEYDPFLIEKAHDFLKNNNPNLTNKQNCKWISEQVCKFYQLSQKNWLKNLSQQKMECIIRTMILQKEVTALRKTDGSNKNLPIRDFTRYLSTLFKANLRNRNVFQIYNKIKSMSYIGRFIEILEQKAGKGADIRKAISSK